MRTGFPAGNLNLFFFLISPTHTPTLRHSLNSLPLTSTCCLSWVRVRRCHLLRPVAISCVCVCVWAGLSVIMRFNCRKRCRKIHHAAGSPCKSRINMECEVFMLQLTADGSIPKMHRDLERGSLQLQFIIIPLGSIEKHLCRYSTCRLVPASGQTVNAVRSFHAKSLHYSNCANLVT